MVSRESIRRALDHEGNSPYLVHVGIALISLLLASPWVALLSPVAAASLAVTVSFIYAAIGLMRHPGPLSAVGS